MTKGWCLTWLLVLGATGFIKAIDIQKTTLDHALSRKIEAFTDQTKLQRFTMLADQIAKKYTNDDFLYQLMHADQIRFEKIRTYNNQLLYEIPIYSLEKVLVPRVGVYVKDLYELLFWGSEIVFDWQLKNRLHNFFVNHTFYYLTHLDEKKLTQFLDQSQEQSDGVEIVTPKKMEPWLTDLASHSLQFPFSLLKRKEIMRMLSRSMVFDRLIALLRSGYLVKDHQNQMPVPIFSLLEKHILAGIFFHSAEMSTLAFMSDFIKKQGFPSYFLSESIFMQGLGAFACQVYFMRWITHYFLVPQWKIYLIEHQATLKKFFSAYRYLKTQIRLCPDGDQDSQIGCRRASEIKKQEKYLDEAFKKFIAEGQKISLTTWVRYKQQKYTQWDFGSTLLLSLPGLYRFGKKIYGFYTAFVDKQQERVGEQKS